ncbi:Uncharacterised protein [Mycobacterium tuberculosis]|nr:Uncharacterised protein [Mycobacterium tuberculosis]CNU89282.1 Uncharacterised protein [Mycobacterium tuberculosis]
MFISGSSTRRAFGGSGSRSVTFLIRLRVTWICMPSTIGAVAAGTTWSLCNSGTPAALSSPATLGAGKCTVRTNPPSLSCTVLALTTGSAIPDSGTRLAREAAAGAVSVIASWASASSTVDAVVHTCLAS